MLNWHLNEGIIATSTIKSKYSYTKAEKIIQYRKKHNAVRHEYFTMAQKYMGYTKVLLTFTVPNRVIRTHNGIKNGRYSKMRVLVDIKAQLAKLLSRETNTKYFTVIELGEKYSSPHLHCQVWIKNKNISSIDNIKNKIIENYNLQFNRCYTSAQDSSISNHEIFTYVIKSFSKKLSDAELWNLEIQKKRYRTQYGKNIRFYSKSKDKYCKSIYRKLYYSLGIVRDKANDFLDFFIKNFYVFTKRNLPKVGTFHYTCVKLGNIFNKGIIDCFCDTNIEVYKIIFYSPSNSPP